MLMLKEIYRILTFISVLVIQISSVCITPIDLSNSNITNTSYCLPVINWNISLQTYNKYNLLDGQALSKYQELYNGYYLKGEITADCLGVAKYFFCANQFSVCVQEQGDKNQVCSWLCNLFQVRCKAAQPIYQQICQSSRISDSKCSYQPILTLLLIMYILIFL